MSENEIKRILDMMDETLEKLLALPDDMLLSIDPRDNESIKEGCEFILAFNNDLAAYSKLTQNLKKRIEKQFAVNSEIEEMEQSHDIKEKRQRIIAELDKTQPHEIRENFTYKRPYGFVLGNNAQKGLKTWKSLYLEILSELSRLDSNKFNKLPEEQKFISKKGNPGFSIEESALRVSEKPLGFDFYVEVNLSANNIRDNIISLLNHFNIPTSSLKIYLREDRDV
jgi:hypothetical protein